MRKVFLFIAVCLAFSSLVGCDGKKKTDGDNAPTLVDSNAAADSTLYGICGEGTSMSVLELITDKGDTLSLLLEGADTCSNVQGGLLAGDHLAVISCKTADGELFAKSVLNITSLMGKWTSIDRHFVLRSCGKAVDRAEVRIDSEDPQNVVGQIQARGTSIMSGYYKNDEATKAAFSEDGWLNTGDLGVIDADGNIFIRGRSKNMILSSNGQNIYPEEIEAAVNNQPYVVESVVVDRASKLVALVYLDQKQIETDGLDGEVLSEKMHDMQVILNKSLPSYSQISKVEIVDKPFEKTPKMSIKRFLYR